MTTNEKNEIINAALENGSDIWMLYKDWNGNITERTITPREWLSPGKLLAYCHLRKEERNFNVSSIVEIKSYSEGDNPLEDISTNLQIPTEILPINATPAWGRPVPRVIHNFQNHTAPQMPFEKVTQADEWQRLMGFYRECLIHEYQQQFTLKLGQLYPISLDQSQVNDFMLGKINLRFTYTQPIVNDPLKKFLEQPTRRRQQLCLAQPLISLEGDNISPVFFTPVTLEKVNENEVIAKSEGYEFSSSALQNLGASPEEVTEFLGIYDQFIATQPDIVERKKFVLTKIEVWLSRSLPVFQPQNMRIPSLPRFAVYDGPCLFWVENNITQNLIDELEILKKAESWEKVPDVIKSLINGSQPHEHSPAPDFIQDARFYVTSINAQQRKAAKSVDEHPITVVTGPPGTGKSQLVLNLISQAYLDGKTVLFASHNNKAVDVVMDRLQGEIHFQGAIRTGSKPNRKSAVEQMDKAINQIHETEIDTDRIRYEGGKKELVKVDEQLGQIKELSSKKISFEAEQISLLEKLPVSYLQFMQNCQISFVESEKQKIKQFLLDSVQEILILQENRNLLRTNLSETLIDVKNYPQSLQTIFAFEDQWGPFGKGLFHPITMLYLDEIIDQSKLCRTVISSLEVKKTKDSINQHLGEKKRALEETSKSLDEEQNLASLELSDQHLRSEIQIWRSSIVEIEKMLAKLINNDFPILIRALKWARLYNPQKKCVNNLKIIFTQAGLLTLQEQLLKSNLAEQNEICQKSLNILKSSLLFQEIDTLQVNWKKTEDRYKSQINGLQPEIVSDISKINLKGFEDASLLAKLDTLIDEGKTLLTHRQEIAARCIRFLVNNSQNISFLSEFKNSITDSASLLFSFSESTPEDDLHILVNYWQQIIGLWETNNLLANVNSQFQELPSEKEALQSYKETNQKLFNLAGKLMQETWFHRGANMDRETFAGTKDYISAVRQLNEIEYSSNRQIYSGLKEMERINFKYAIRMFPVWAITNLTAKTNFPFDPGLFDLVIIDEASQCDIPSAIPLLFRAKRLVIIGDPNQLRHVATLQTGLENQLGKKYGINMGVYSYSTHSLYDISERSIRPEPGPILLDEHYRSDPRIINFSNKEFYAGQLQIKTDLSKRGFEKEFIVSKGGMYWIDVKGKFVQPENGSAYNPAELDQVKILVPELIKLLDNNDLPNTTIGVVTPFRAQETQLNHWIEGNYQGSERIQSGTAHQFQGDERDVMIFSPVLAEGIQKGTLGWLEQTYNLLNVAITRARFCLIILGDWSFCNNLPLSSHYNHLSHYVKDNLKSLYNSISEIPHLDKKKFDILGTILDPSNPENNRTTLERFIGSLTEYIWWTDSYFDESLIELMDNLFAGDHHPPIKDIRLLTAERQIKFFQGKPPAIRADSIISLQDYIKNKGVQFEFRVLPGEEMPHDRFLYYPGRAINMPPFASAYGKHGHFSEYTPSNTTKDDFLKYWDKATSV